MSHDARVDPVRDLSRRLMEVIRVALATARAGPVAILHAHGSQKRNRPYRLERSLGHPSGRLVRAGASEPDLVSPGGYFAGSVAPEFARLEFHRPGRGVDRLRDLHGVGRCRVPGVRDPRDHRPPADLQARGARVAESAVDAGDPGLVSVPGRTEGFRVGRVDPPVRHRRPRRRAGHADRAGLFHPVPRVMGAGIVATVVLVAGIVFLIEVHPVILFRHVAVIAGVLYKKFDALLAERRDKQEQIEHEQRDLAKRRRRLEDVMKEQESAKQKEQRRKPAIGPAVVIKPDGIERPVPEAEEPEETFASSAEARAAEAGQGGGACNGPGHGEFRRAPSTNCRRWT